MKVLTNLREILCEIKMVHPAVIVLHKMIVTFELSRSLKSFSLTIQTKSYFPPLLSKFVLSESEILV